MGSDDRLAYPRPGAELDAGLHLDDGLADYWSPRWRRNNARRLEFLTALRLPIGGRRVLELGAGIGDHTEFLVDRNCEVTAVEGRSAAALVLRTRFAQHPEVHIHELDLDPPADQSIVAHDVVLCLGLLYHLAHPGALVEWAAPRAGTLFILETIVDPATGVGAPTMRSEDPDLPGASIHGTASRVTREWVWAALTEHFPHVYATTRQVPHYEFPVDWAAPSPHATRAVFIGSRDRLVDPWLTDALPARHVWP